VDFPGPPGAVWAVGLLLWAGAAAVVGEFIRGVAARRVSWWREPEILERLLLDFYLGGALLYLVAALPLGLFVAPLVFGIPIAAAAGIGGLALARGRAGPRGESLVRSLRSLARPAYGITIGSALLLFVLELAVALPVGTGNTFDSGLLTTYTALLLRNHSIPLSLQPYAATAVLYPQGTSVWLGWAQLTFGLPPARTSLLVTPLFFALAPLAGFVFGRRMFGTDRAGLAAALTFAWLAPATRGLVGGSNDFVFAFPLVLLLAGQANAWFREAPPAASDAIGFGLLLGYSAALNPVGAEWLFLALLVGGAVARPRWSGRPAAWLARWAVALGTALIAVLPSLYVLVRGHASPGFVPGAAAAPAGSPTGIPASQFIGFLDPFLFRSSDTALSPIPALRLELAILIVVGLAILLLATPGSALGRYLDGFRRWVVGTWVALTALLATLYAASFGFGPAVALSGITSAGEVSTWVFTVYVLVAAVPLLLALERFTGWVGRMAAPRSPEVRTRRAPARRDPAAFDASRAVIPLGVALLIVGPAVALTPVALPPVLTGIYDDFGNVSADDFALLEFAGTHLPAGARVLIAPGSSADFLPGYAPDLVLLYPLIPGWQYTNASYNLLVREISNGTLDARGEAALTALSVGYVVVTENNSVLWPTFSPAPFLADPSEFPPLFHSGPAYLFARTPA
jgi:hypothetical protein